jgi:UDP-N-acetylmuramate--alanine ligase
MMLHQGKKVSGSDRAPSDITHDLENHGVTFFASQVAENISSDVDLVVYTVAIPPENPELKKAQELGIKLLTYPQFLGVISKDKLTIAITGTHGKTTTTAMVAKILIDAGLDPTVIVGSLIKNEKGERTNFIAGKSKYLVIEACEYKRSFLSYYPQMLVITNIDNDHLDYYKDLADIQSAFNELAKRIPQDGFIFTDKNNAAIIPALEGVEAKVVNYTLYNSLPIELKVPGIHNKKNAAAAFAVATALEIEPSVAQKSLEGFAGTWRRFEYLGETKNGAKVYDDYGHHPTEIKATLQGARELFPRERLIVAFEPHLYSRTKLLLEEFAGAFDAADEVVLAPIYAAREVDDGSISSEMLKEKIAARNIYALSFKTLEEVENYLANESKKGNIIVTMGAGDIYKIAERMVK